MSFVENVNKLATDLTPEVISGIADVVVHKDELTTLHNNIVDIVTVVDTVVPNLPEILLADDNAAIATAQASIATTKANEASASATAAAVSEANAALLLDSFDDRYLGSKTADPAVDNDGNTLLVGALYFNTVSNKIKVWTGTVWDNAFTIVVEDVLNSTSTINALSAAQGKVLNDRLIAVENGTVQEGDSVELTGDVIGTAVFDSNGNVSVVTTIVDDSHNHTTANVDGLQTALDNKQPLDATLTALAGVSTSADKYIYATASDTFTTGTITSFGRSLVDDANAATARATLGLGNVDNTSDANKPISIAQQSALNLKVSKDSDTGAASIPAGTTAERPISPSVGYTRFNTTDGLNETWNGAAWVQDISSVNAVTLGTSQTITGTKLFTGRVEFKNDLSISFYNATQTYKTDVVIPTPTANGTVTMPSSGTLGTTADIATAKTEAINAGLGVGQTWQDVTASRVAGVTYTNTTGKVIIAIGSWTSSVDANSWGYINGVQIARINSSNFTGSVVLVIPNNSTYSFSSSGVTLLKWSELR